MAQKDDAYADTDSDDCLELKELPGEEDVPVTPLHKLLFADVLQAPRTYIEGSPLEFNFPFIFHIFL